MMLTEAKEKGAVLDAEAEAFLADVECTAPYDQPLAITTTNIFEVSHEDAYDFDVDEGPHAAAAFMANLSSTSGTNDAIISHVNEVHTDDNQIFDNVNHLLAHEMHQEEHLDFDVESDIDDNTILYHQYQLDGKVQDVPTEVSFVSPGEIFMIIILDDLRNQLDGHLKVNQEQSMVNDSLRAELARCSFDKQALETELTQLKDAITSVRIQNDGFKLENVNLKHRYQELSTSNSHSRDTLTRKITALTAENAKLKYESLSKMHSEPIVPEKPNVLAPMMYAIRVKPSIGASKPMFKSDTRNHSTLPAKREKARRVEDYHRNLNKQNHVDSRLNVKRTGFVSNSNTVCNACNESLVFANHDNCVVRNLKSVNVKTPTAKHNVKTTKKVWKAKVVTVRSQWKPTGRRFTLYDEYPLTRIVEPIVEPLELTPCISSNSKVTMISKFIDYKLSNRKAGSKGISDSGCSRHMNGDRPKLTNYVDNFIGTMRFENDQFAAIIGYCDYKLGNTIISRVNQ
nr:hypothetical protein [Tanacetum cinerariifolium]